MTSNSDQPQEKSQDATTETASRETAAAAPRARLTRLKINRFRQVKPGTELRFDDGINVLLGRNGTGKTTLLELICTLVSGDLRAYQQEGFDLELELFVGGLAFVIRARNTLTPKNRPHLTATAEPAWGYTMSLGDASGLIAEADVSRKGAWIKDMVTHGSAVRVEEASLFRPLFYLFQWLRFTNPSKRLAEGITNAHIQYMADGIMSCIRLDEGLAIFRCVTEGKPLPRLGAQLTICPYSGLDAAGPPEDPQILLLRLAQTIYAPQSLFQQLSEHGQSVHESNEISFRSDELDFMSRASNAMNVKDMQLTTRLLRREQTSDESSTLSRFGIPSFWITTHRGTTYTHDQLSYGEKRLLAFMYHAAANPDILVADEIVNGMHYDWIDLCLAAIQGQAFLTSQNPSFLDHLSFESAEEVQRRFVLCDSDENGNWIWRNMDFDTADAFYRAYEVGLQHVGEILRTSGLW